MSRIEKICSFVEKTEIFADIGCDHGLVCKRILDEKKADTVCACDVSGECIKKAEKTLSGYDGAKFFVGDGFDPINKVGIIPGEAVVSGMGGGLIIKILSRCPKTVNLVLGAQKNVDKLREWLIENGYKIVRDEKKEDHGKFYDVIRAVPGKSQLSATQIEFGAFYDVYNPDLLKYFALVKSKLALYKKTDANVALLSRVTQAEEQCLKSRT